MRTTVNLDDDVAAAITSERATSGMGLSETINSLIRRGLVYGGPGRRKKFRQRTFDMGLRIDISNTAEALDLLEGPSHR